MSLTPCPMSLDLYQYLVDLSVREPSMLQQLREQSLLLPGSQMLTAPEQMQFITLLLKLMGATRIIEIGTFTGYSTLAMALALPAAGQLITCDIHPEPPQLGQKFWHQAGVANKIELCITPGLTLLDELILQGEANQFDFALVDADKKNNYAYYEKLLTLLRSGGLVVIDNVLWNARVIDSSYQDATTNAIRHFNQRLQQDDRIDLTIVPLGDGLTLARKK